MLSSSLFIIPHTQRTTNIYGADAQTVTHKKTTRSFSQLGFRTTEWMVFTAGVSNSWWSTGHREEDLFPSGPDR